MSFWSYWYFHLPNFVLAAVMYTLLGRMVLGLFVPADWDNYIWRFFRRVTDPYLKLVRYVTPQILSDGVVMVFGVLWLMVLRLGWFFFLLQFGLAPVGGQGS
ncbi:YggT family protein [Mesorhizobium microcysteis]|jgi:uncharacterized protein YggT (Ycf19 family)|uniref:YggT family protein n=1 Tax=Neoaquamicrobium microcysteis TaxID=2682781 RepID=A0A5D4H4S4_9HYPH|nr:YggT family protein [Mesorhizobium microcysteis]TYR35253.1 YggT family protein [Mesorhizobium microcysteis]